MTDMTNETINIEDNQETIQNQNKVKRPRGTPKKTTTRTKKEGNTFKTQAAASNMD